MPAGNNSARRPDPTGRPLLRHGYNLVELVVTIAVLGTLLGLAMPAIRSIANASNLTLGSSSIANELKRARQHAIGQNRYVAVLMPTAQPSNQGGIDEIRYRAHSYRTCYLAGKPRYDAATKSYVGTFDGYLSASQWQFLPGGVFLAGKPGEDGDGQTNGNWGPTATTNRCNSVDGLNFPDSISSTQVHHVRAVMFRPNGAVMPAPTGGATSGTNTTIDVVKGGLDLAHLGYERVLTEGVNHQRMEINHFTGKLDFVE